MKEIEVKTTLYVTEDGERFNNLESAQEHEKHLEAVKKLETFRIDGPSCTPFDEVTIHAYDWQWYKVHDHDELDQVLRLIYKAYNIGHIRYFRDKCSKFPQYIGVSCNHKCMTTLAGVEQKHNLEMNDKMGNFYYAFKNDLKKDRESAVNKVKMTIEDHIRNLDYIMDSMPDDACGDWRDSLAYAIEDLQQKINNDDIIDQIKKEFIDLYPKNYMGGLDLDGCCCEFSLNKVLKILDKYKKKDNT